MSHEGSAAAVSDGPARKSAKVEKAPQHNPDPLCCSYYVSRKHRFCRTECKPGSRYCCTHHVSLNDGVGANASETKTKEGEAHLDEADGTAKEGRSAEVRVPCPINPNHTVYASRLAKHVTVCPDLRFVTDQLPYFSDNKHAHRGAIFVPAASTEGTEAGSARRTHRDLAPDALAALLDKVAECYRTCVEPEMVVMPSCTTTTAAPEEAVDAARVPASALSEPSLATISHSESSSQKHGPQHTALLRCLSDVVMQSHSEDSILARYAMCQPATEVPLSPRAAPPIHLDGFLEFGAGKGGLSVALQQLIVQHLAASEPTAQDGGHVDARVAAPSAKDTSEVPAESPAWPFLSEVAAHPPLVVLDMDGFRRKGDARVRHSAVPLQRLRINIKDVHLTRAFVSEIRPLPSPLELVDEGEKKDVSGVGTVGRPVQNWAVLGKHLCGACTDFALSCLTEAPSLAAEAQVRLPVVVIATCCHHRCELTHLNPPAALVAGEEAGDGGAAVLRMPGSDLTWTAEEFAALASMSSWAVCGGFVDEARRLAGRQCKRILDQLRVHFLRRLGYVAFQCQYTTRDVTEENVCIIAFQQPK